jgi:hypothetical protein
MDFPLSHSLRLNRIALLHAALLTLLVLPTIASAGPLQFVPITPCRVVNTTVGLGGPALAAKTTRTFDIRGACGIPQSASVGAYSLNVSVLPKGFLNWLTMWPAGDPKPYVSTLNSWDGRIKANAAILVAAGTNGGVSAWATDPTDLVLDVDGYFDTSGLDFFPITPCRIVDTRKTAGPLGGPALTAGEIRAFPLQSTPAPCGDLSSAKAYSLNITAIPQQSTLSYLTAWSGGTQPGTSTLNAPTGAITANAAIVSAGSGGGISIFVTNAANVIIDVNGYFAAPANGGLSFYSVTECRVYDSRSQSAAGAFSGMRVVPMLDNPSCKPPSAAEAYVLNATIVPPGKAVNYLSLWADGSPQPNTSTLNAREGKVTSNMAIVSNFIGNLGTFSNIDAVVSGGPTYLIIDLSGYFAPPQ